jgi:4-diphosphocytidyl-2-C-methyl-D-erythritol kinase
MTPLRLDAPAKLNLSLRVIGRRPDGFHEIESLLVLLDLADRLLLMPGNSGLRVEGPAAPAIPIGPDNLAWRGLVAGLAGEPDLACLTIEKQVPVGAGLGGGSSDAAAAWRLGRRWRGAAEVPTPREMRDLSAFGADVPFFAAGLPAAVVQGIGERVEGVELPGRQRLHAILATPPRPLPTAAVFAELKPADWSTERNMTLDPLAEASNDLLGPARRLRPELDDLFRLVLAAGGVPRLTGSGPTLYVLTDDADRAGAVAGRLDRAGVRVTVTRLRAEPASIEPLSEDEEAP